MLDIQPHLTSSPKIQLIQSLLRARGKTPVYSVDKHWAINLYSFKGRILCPDLEKEYIVDKSDLCILPAGVNRQFEISQSGRHRVVLFDFLPLTPTPQTEPVILHNPGNFKRLEYLFDQALLYHNRGQLERCGCIFYNLMWLVSDLLENLHKPAHSHPAVNAAINHIANSLDKPISAAGVAEISQISHNQLNRLFNQNFSMSINRYIQSKRMENAASLLRTTDIPIKEIAIECGIPDLQKFNKTFRKFHTISPRAFRQNIT